MLFRKKSKPVSPPAPVMAPLVINGEPDMRGLGRILWAKKARILGITMLAAATAFAVVNAMTPRYRSESRLLLEARENVFLRAEADKNNSDRTTIDPEAVTSQIQLVLSRDLARQVIKKEKLTDQLEFDPSIGGRSVLKTILGMFGIGRDPSTLTQEERTLEILLRPAQRLRGGKIPRNRHRFQFSQSRACRPRRQRDCGGLPANAAGRQAGSNPRRRQLAGRRDRQPAYEGGRRRSQGR